jgi:hypothetical protein
MLNIRPDKYIHATPLLTVDHVIDTTIKLFNNAGYHQGLTRLQMTHENLLSGREIYTTIRPYSVYRDVCIALCAELTDAGEEALVQLFAGSPPAMEAAAKALRQINIQQADYVAIYKQLHKNLVRPEEKLAAAIKDTPPAAAVPPEEDKPAAQESKKPPAANPPFEADPPPPPVNRHKQPEIRDVKAATVVAWNELFPKDRVSSKILDSDGRSWFMVRPRQLSMYMSKCVLPASKSSLPTIGREHGGRDHTTVLHSFRKVAKQINDKDETILKLIEKISLYLQLTEQEIEIVLHPKSAEDNNKAKHPSGTESHLRP